MASILSIKIKREQSKRRSYRWRREPESKTEWGRIRGENKTARRDKMRAKQPRRRCDNQRNWENHTRRVALWRYKSRSRSRRIKAASLSGAQTNQKRFKEVGFLWIRTGIRTGKNSRTKGRNTIKRRLWQLVHSLLLVGRLVTRSWCFLAR